MKLRLSDIQGGQAVHMHMYDFESHQWHVYHVSQIPLNAHAESCWPYTNMRMIQFVNRRGLKADYDRV